MPTHLERFNAAMEKRIIDRVPCGFSATPEMVSMIERTYQTAIDGFYRQHDIDMRGASAGYTGPVKGSFPDGSYLNPWGVRMKTVRYEHGEYEEAVFNPLHEMSSVQEMEKYPYWPSPDDFAYGAVGKTLSEHPDDPYIVGYLSIGWFAWQLRGMEQHLEDLILDARIADFTVEKIGGWGLAYFERLLKENAEYISKNLVAIHLADDMGSQKGLMLSPEHYRRYYKPWYRKICDMAHNRGVRVEFHSCGGIFELIPDLIDTGIDILNPLQTSAQGMDPVRIRREFGDDIAFSGGIDAQQVLPFYTPDEVRREVFHLLDTMQGSGYILEPGHAIQIGTPPENVMAMYCALHEYYGLK